MRLLYLATLFALLYLTGPDIWAQNRFTRLNTGDGLSHNTVHDLLQDQKGFLWFATTDGLNRYDGLSFQVYRRSHRDPNSLRSNELTGLLEDKAGRLWVGTRSGGLSILDKSGIRFNHILKTVDGQDISTLTITSLAQDGSGNVWVGTHGMGLLLVDPQTRKARKFPVKSDPLLSNDVLRICPDNKGNLWIGFANGVVARMKLSDYHIDKYNLPNKATQATGNIMTLLCDQSGNIWAGTQGWGLFLFDQHQDHFKTVFFKEGVVEGVNIARSLYQDNSGRYWLGTDDGVVTSEDSAFKKIVHIRAEQNVKGSLSTHATVCVRGDRQGNVWIGTWEGGINILFARKSLFERHTYELGQPNGLLDPQVAAVVTDRNHNIWMGGRQGLTYLDRKNNTYKHIRHQPGVENSLPGNDVTLIEKLSGNNLLISIWNKGSYILDAKVGKVIRHLSPLRFQQIQTALPIKNNHFLLVTNQGEVWNLSTENWRIERIKEFKKSNGSLTSVVSFADSVFWIGTYGEGLIEWHRSLGTVRYHLCTQRRGALYDSHITSLFKDRRGNLWVGTLGGLHRYNPSGRSFELISTDNGLPNDAIMSIMQDKKGHLWVATNDGLCQMDESGRVLRTFHKEDGLAGNDFTEKAVSQSEDGTFFLGGKHGLTVFNPSHFETSDLFPVYLTGMKLFNRPVLAGTEGSPLKMGLPDTKSIVLRYDQSVVTFDFAAVLFQEYRNVRYAYRLEGFEITWNDVGAQHSATYTNLDPGNYRLRVKASASDDFKQASETSLKITVLPPWYRTSWAYLLYTLTIAILLLLIRRVIQIREGYKTEIRIKHIQTEKALELDRLRSGFFANISHEFRTPLTLILSPLEQFLSDRTPDPRRIWFRTMHQNANRLLRLINQLLDLSKLESGLLRPAISRQDVHEFIWSVAKSFEPAALQRRIAIRIDTDLGSVPAYFDPDILEKVLYNLIANSLKFTPEGGAVSIRFKVDELDSGSQLFLEVKDTGIGISAEHASHIFDRFYQVNDEHRSKKAGTGIGLALTRELIELHKGTIDVESKPGEGTTFKVCLPISMEAFPHDWLASSPGVLGEISAAPEIWSDTNSDVPSTKMVSVNRGLLPLLLIVEDHDDLRHYLTDCFELDFRVLAASNGKEALGKAEKEIPDLIISDWLMPEMDGVKLCAAIKSNEKTSHVPFILLTSKSGTESNLRGLRIGADDYITKPFNVEILRARAKNLIASRQKLREKYSRLLHMQATDISGESIEEQFLKRVLSVIERYLADPELNMQLLERELGMSNTQLYRKLKALTGKGGNELIRGIRLERGRQLLAAGGRQVAEVSDMVGFSDPNYFVRVFKKEFGIPPGEYTRLNPLMDKWMDT